MTQFLSLLLAISLSASAWAGMASSYCHTGTEPQDFRGSQSIMKSVCFETQDSFLGTSAEEKAHQLCRDWFSNMGFIGQFTSEVFTVGDVERSCYVHGIHYVASLHPPDTHPHLYFTESRDLIANDNDNSDNGRMDSSDVFVESGVIDQQYVRGVRYIDDGGATNPQPIYYDDAKTDEKAQWMQFPDGQIYCGFPSVENNISFQGDSHEEVRIRRRISTEGPLSTFNESVFVKVGETLEWRASIYELQSGEPIDGSSRLEVYIGEQYSMPSYSFFKMGEDGEYKRVKMYRLHYSPGSHSENGSASRSCD
jgi:hypothetical protein